jgi:hypothetical protein
VSNWTRIIYKKRMVSIFYILKRCSYSPSHSGHVSLFSWAVGLKIGGNNQYLSMTGGPSSCSHCLDLSRGNQGSASILPQPCTWPLPPDLFRSITPGLHTRPPVARVLHRPCAATPSSPDRCLPPPSPSSLPCPITQGGAHDDGTWGGVGKLFIAGASHLPVELSLAPCHSLAASFDSAPTASVVSTTLASPPGSLLGHTLMYS